MGKNIGVSVFEDISRWEKDPAFKKAVKEHFEKAKSRADAQRDLRERKHFSIAAC